MAEVYFFFQVVLFQIQTLFPLIFLIFLSLQVFIVIISFLFFLSLKMVENILILILPSKMTQ